jgi:hypothetical protein
MFMMHMPEDFKIGDSADCHINGEPARLTWRDKDTLVIGEDDVRTILTTHIENGLRCFFCGDRDVPAHQHGIDIVPDGGFIVYEKPPTKPNETK